MSSPPPGKRIVISLDGTWNNPDTMRMREDGTSVLKPTNCLKMARAVSPRDTELGMDQVTYYDSGVGAMGTYPGLANTLDRKADRILGGAWGAGFEGNIDQAVTFLTHNYLPGDQVFVFGFSRGAAQARGLTRFIDWMGGVPAKSDGYFVPLLFRHYLGTGGKGNPGEVHTSKEKKGLGSPMASLTVDLLAVWDTVMALGSRFRLGRGTSVKERAFHTGPKPARCVRHARQALAIDEERFDFQPEVWTGSHEGQTLEQRWFPGAHTNVGGGQPDDGLANGSFKWFLKEANALGLATDKNFTKHYPAYPFDAWHPSSSFGYKVGEFVRGHAGKGRRKLVGYSETAALRLDASVVHRIRERAGTKDHPELKDAYRPRNVLALLEENKDRLAEFLEATGAKPTDPLLPKDVMESL